MTDKPYLDKDAILNASELVNSTLTSKGYITEKLLFNTINSKELHPEREESDVVVTEKIYNNDKNVINIIYSLIQSIERNSVQNKTFNKIVSQKDTQIESLRRQVEVLQNKLNTTESKISKFENNEKVQLEGKIHELSITNKNLTLDCNKLKNWGNDLRNHFQIRIKKKNIEIDQLKDKLIEKSLTRNINNGGSSINELNQTIIYNNNPTINNAVAYNNSIDLQQLVLLQHLNEPLKLEYESLMMDLSKLIDNLILENYKFSKFIQLINTYYSDLNLQISSFNRNKSEMQIPNPSSVIDLESLKRDNIVSSISSRSGNGGGNVSDLVNELESFEVISKPLLTNVYKNYHYLLDLVEHLKQSLVEDPKQISKLKHELEIVRKNWQDAITTLDDWKSYNNKGD